MATPFDPLLNPSQRAYETLISQGAEAQVYKSQILPVSSSSPTTLHHGCIRKHRPRRPYRHPLLDAKLTRHRTLSEARALTRCRKLGIQVPAVLFLDSDDLYLQFIDGTPLRDWLFSLTRSATPDDRTIGTQPSPPRDAETCEVRERGEGNGKGEWCVEGDGGMDAETLRKVSDVMNRVGRVVGSLHDGNLVHGDLTTSNILISSSPSPSASASFVPLARKEEDEEEDEGKAGGKAGGKEERGEEEGGKEGGEEEIWLIDFGLSATTLSVEDKAVDLLVLDRAMTSTHTRIAGTLMRAFMDGYISPSPKCASASANGTMGKRRVEVVRKLESVRMRGRKRTMVG